MPHQLVGKRLEVRAGITAIEVFWKGRRIASHPKCPRPGQAHTLDEHMPKAHRAYKDWSPERIISWAAKIGPATAHFVQEMMSRKKYPELAYRASLGLIRLAKLHTAERLEAACERATAVGCYSYKNVTYTVQTGDTLDTIAAGVSTLINASSNLQAIGVTSTNSASANFINSENFTASPLVASGASLATASATDGGGTTKTNPYRTNTNGIPANQSLTFDLNGNMTSDGTNTYQWDAENRLIQINYPGTGNYSKFTYDPFEQLSIITEVANSVVVASNQLVTGLEGLSEFGTRQVH